MHRPRASTTPAGLSRLEFISRTVPGLPTKARRWYLFQCTVVDLFGSGKERWTQRKARAFVRALEGLWEAGS